MKKIIAEEQLEGREVDARFCWSCKTFTVFNITLVKGIEKYEIIRNEFDIDEVGLEMIENYCDATDLAIIEGRQSKGEAFYNKITILFMFQTGIILTIVMNILQLYCMNVVILLVILID